MNITRNIRNIFFDRFTFLRLEFFYPFSEAFEVPRFGCCNLERLFPRLFSLFLFVFSPKAISKLFKIVCRWSKHGSPTFIMTTISENFFTKIQNLFPSKRVRYAFSLSVSKTFVSNINIYSLIFFSCMSRERGGMYDIFFIFFFKERRVPSLREQLSEIVSEPPLSYSLSRTQSTSRRSLTY